MKIFKSLISVLTILFFFSCQNKNKEYQPMNKPTDQHEVIITEILNSSGYLYIKFQDGAEEIWMATDAADVKVGDKVYFKEAVEMRDFKSKELDRTFEKILFVDQVSKQPIPNRPKPKVNQQHTSVKRGPKESVLKLLDSIKIEPLEGTLSVEQVFRDVDHLIGEQVAVHGVVVKINSDIMDRNWVHLMDGTHGENRYSMSFTTQEVLQVGDTVVMQGKLAKDKEYGAGYIYPVIIEDAVVK